MSPLERSSRGLRVHGYPGPRRKPREQLVQFLREFTRDRRLVLHIPERGTELLRTWLVEDLPLLPNIFLAFSSSRSERFMNDAETDIKPLRTRVEPFLREEMAGFLSEMFGEHRLSPALGDALWRATHGYPAFLAIKLCDLISRGTIYRDEDERWCMASEGVVAPDCVEVLETDLYEPIEAVLHRLREEGRGVLAHRAAQFLKIAGLCGSVVPVQLTTHYLGFFEDEENELIDSIDEYFIGNVEAPLFQDLAYSHPGFPKFAVYAFANPVLQRVLVHRLGIERHKRVEVAARFYRHLREVMPIRSRAVATLYASVLEQANEESKREAMESELAWWVGVEETEALQTHLTQRLKHGALDSEGLWLLYERIKNRWRAYRQLAVLSAYGEQPNGIPWSRAPYWHERYALTLYELGRYEEARDAAREAISRLQDSGSSMEGRLVNVLGMAEVDLGFLKEAETSFRRALEISEKALGPDHPDVATGLNNLAALYHAQGRYAEVESLCQRALGMREKALGPDHPDVAQSLNNLAGVYDTQGGRYAEAEPLHQRALGIWEKALGSDHPHVGTSLSNLARLYFAQGRYAEVEPLCQRVLGIREKAFGPDHPDVATSLSNLARLYYAQGRYAEAEPLCQRALGMREKALGPDHPDVAASLNNLAALYRAQGRYAEAEPLYQRALAIREKALGPDHPDVATSLNNLAVLYRTQGRHAEAEPLYQRALAIREKALGPDHPDVAMSLNNLAELYRIQGRYAEAEPLYQRALAIREKALGPDHPDVATSLNNLALRFPGSIRRGRAALPAGAGDPGESPRPRPPRCGHASTTWPGSTMPRVDTPRPSRSTGGRWRSGRRPSAPTTPMWPQASTTWPGSTVTRAATPRPSRSTSGRWRSGRRPSAPTTPMWPRASTTWPGSTMPRADTPRPSRSTGGRWRSGRRPSAPTTPMWPQASTTWPGSTMPRADYAEAEPLYQRALRIREKALGPDHPDVATSLNNLAGLYDAQGRYADAEPLCQRALGIREKALGLDHPDVATVLENYAVLLRKLDRVTEAESMDMRAQAIRMRLASQK